jgi:hypothetical protein
MNPSEQLDPNEVLATMQAVVGQQLGELLAKNAYLEAFTRKLRQENAALRDQLAAAAFGDGDDTPPPAQ